MLSPEDRVLVADGLLKRRDKVALLDREYLREPHLRDRRDKLPIQGTGGGAAQCGADFRRPWKVFSTKGLASTWDTWHWVQK